MRRLARFSPQVGSSPIESLLVGALVFLVAAAIVGFSLVLFLGPRAATGDAASSGPTAPSATTVPPAQLRMVPRRERTVSSVRLRWVS